MTVKASISLTDTQEAFARDLVARGVYPSLSAVMQHGIEMLREETEARRATTDALRALLAERREGDAVSIEEGKARTRAMIAGKRAAHGLAG